jgi:4-amino-4-deoxy-L-arabinose transferase-like glycosyltransferase
MGKRSLSIAVDRRTSCRRLTFDRRFAVCFFVCLCALHVLLLAWSSWAHAAVTNEAEIVSSGVFFWQTGRYDLFQENPPLVKVISSAAIAQQTKWCVSESDLQIIADPVSRPERSVAIEFVSGTAAKSRLYFLWARLSCVPFSLLAAYVCWWWAGELAGRTAAAFALVQWCLTPNVLAWGATTCTDCAASAAGVAAAYCFWRWLRALDYPTMCLAALALGGAQLTKMTLLLLFPVWAAFWLLWMLKTREALRLRRAVSFIQFASIVALALLILNVAYGLRGSLTRLDDYTFVCRALAGSESVVDGNSGGNCFRNRTVGKLPIPLPSDYVEGADLQRLDFEKGARSYLLGRWSERGFWSYYLVAAICKLPIAWWVLFFLAIAARVAWPRAAGVFKEIDRLQLDRTAEALLLLSAMAILALISSQSGFSQHCRYALPAYPFLVIWTSCSLVRFWQLDRRWRKCIVALLTCMVVETLFVYPHSMSFFNALAGGPRRGDRILLHSAVDWGQDAYYLSRWLAQHRDVHVLHTGFMNAYTADLIRANADFDGGSGGPLLLDVEEVGPNHLPHGWFAVSVHRVHDPADPCHMFSRIEPSARIGYSILIYHL